MRKVVSGNFHRRRESCWNGVAYVLRDQFGVVEILTDDGRGCGSRKKNWVTKNLVANG